MSDFNPATLDWTAEPLAGWAYVEPVNKWFQGSWRAGHKITRQCPTCGNAIELDVTTKALRGEAKNHGLALRRCKTCRAALKKGPQVYTIHKETVQQGLPRETVVNVVTDETLRTINRTLEQEIDGLNMLLREANAKLAKYELQPALVAAHQTESRMPWE